ncbi:MAG: lysine--tRNA ligase, partial [Rhodospirillaceae bacterium]|nr:lysine--tRNA ligase [Rhodospirillaceae bacterium]
MTDADLPIPEEFRDNPLTQPRLDKRAALAAAGVDPYPYRFDPTDKATSLQARYAELPDDTVTEDTVRVAGRIRALRNSGMFIDLHDASGKIQIFSHKDYLDDAGQALLAQLDIGDMLGVEGAVRRTRRGELTVNATSLTVLAKALLPLPEKYHGLTDQEARYRQRYLDLIMNEDSRDTLRARSRIIASIRAELEARGFLEVETPMLQSLQGGAAARPFVTHHNTLDMDMFLRIAPELYLKRLIVGGLSDRVFEIGRCFRNEGISPRHNPEFTMLEMYQAYADWTDMMEVVEALLSRAALAAAGGTRVAYGDREIELAGPYPRMTMIELVAKATGV